VAAWLGLQGFGEQFCYVDGQKISNTVDKVHCEAPLSLQVGGCGAEAAAGGGGGSAVGGCEPVGRGGAPDHSYRRECPARRAAAGPVIAPGGPGLQPFGFGYPLDPPPPPPGALQVKDNANHTLEVVLADVCSDMVANGLFFGTWGWGLDPKYQPPAPPPPSELPLGE